MLDTSVILVVDDEATNRALLRASLASSYTILEAEDGRGALDLLDRAPIAAPVDLVLLDVMMPELNGFDTCREIKLRQRDSFLPVVLLTALNSVEDRNEGLAAGADEFLSKPIDRRELILRVRSLLRVRRQEAQIREQLGTLRAKEELLRRQLDELQHLQVLKDDLFSLIVHDLRNPLAGVVGYLEVLQLQLADPPRARKTADKATEAAQKLRGLLDEVLEVQRLEEAGLPIKPEPVPVESIIRDAVAVLEGAAKVRGILLEVEVEGEPVLALDRSLVRRAVENFIANAIKFSARDEAVQIRVRRDRDRIVVEVADRGPGISDSVKVQLFKKFAAVEARRTGDRRRGFGLGLHLVKLVASAHGGEVSIRDNEGGGAVFVMSFPDRSA